MSFSVDGVPIISQVKGAVLLLKGEKEAAKETQSNFTKRLIGVAQVRCAVQMLSGDADGAKETHKTFIDNATRLFDQAGEVANVIPVVAQVKSLVKYADGDAEGAWETQDTFSKRCPVFSQIRSYTEIAVGNAEGASETKREFNEKTWNKIDTVPVVGHINGVVQSTVKKDSLKGQEAFEKANTTVAMLLSVAKDTVTDMLTNSSGSGVTGQSSLQKWQSQYSRSGAREYSGIDAAPLLICTQKLCASHPDGCQICLKQFEEGDLVRLLPCLHMFHGGDDAFGKAICIDAWLRGDSGEGRKDCPMCRKKCTAWGDR